MNDLIERYVGDVVRRLPENDREDVRRELNANIYDMLPDEPAEEDIRRVLNELGPPAALAEEYRPHPRYLISPAYYDDYVRALKWVVPLVGGILLAVGLAIGAVDAIKGDAAGSAKFISSIISSGVSMGVSGAVQALVWVTVGFVIAERTGSKVTVITPGEWSVDMLPEDVPDGKDKSRIPLSDSIVELVLLVVFSIVAIMFCMRIFPTGFMLVRGDVRVHTLFSDSFVAACIPVIVIGVLFSVAECVAKIVWRRWSPPVCAAVVVSGVVNMGLMLYLVTRPEIFSAEFAAFIETQKWGSFDLMRFMGNPVGSPLLALIAGITIFATVLECAIAIYRTVRTSRAMARAGRGGV